MTLPVASMDTGLGLLAPRVGEAVRGLGPQTPDALPTNAFGDMLVQMVESASTKANTADAAAKSFAAGARDDIHGTMLALKEADIELRLVSNVRTKLVDAFNDLLRMNI